MDRSRRSNFGSRNINSSALEALKAARLAAGSSRSSQLKLRDEGDVYEELTEEQYIELVNQRREQDGFIDDDLEGFGFIDNGEEDWEQNDPNDPKKQKISKVARVANKNNKTQLLGPNGPISGIFLGGGKIIGPTGSSSLHENNI